MAKGAGGAVGARIGAGAADAPDYDSGAESFNEIEQPEASGGEIESAAAAAREARAAKALPEGVASFEDGLKMLDQLDATGEPVAEPDPEPTLEEIYGLEPEPEVPAGAGAPTDPFQVAMLQELADARAERAQQQAAFQQFMQQQAQFMTGLVQSLRPQQQPEDPLRAVLNTIPAEQDGGTRARDVLSNAFNALRQENQRLLQRVEQGMMNLQNSAVVGSRQQQLDALVGSLDPLVQPSVRNLAGTYATANPTMQAQQVFQMAQLAAYDAAKAQRALLAARSAQRPKVPQAMPGRGAGAPSGPRAIQVQGIRGAAALVKRRLAAARRAN